MWKIRLRGVNGQLITLQLNPDDTMELICEEAKRQLQLKPSDCLELKYGYPPSVLTYSLQDKISTTPIKNNDTIIVSTLNNKTTRNQTKSPAKSRTRGVKSVLKSPKNEKGIKTIHARSNPTTSERKLKKQRGQGVLLGKRDDPPVDSSTADIKVNEKQVYQRVKRLTFTSKEDVGMQLVTAHTSGKKTDRASKFFRHATKSAIVHQYEVSLATSRYKAALAKKFHIRELYTIDDRKKMMIVCFQERVRLWRDEKVEWLEPVMLTAVIKYTLCLGEVGRENLKAMNMAHVSPRVFWNLARIYDGDIESGLQNLIPDEDWGFLEIRKRELSEKAKASIAHEREWQEYERNGENGAKRRRKASINTLIEVEENSLDEEVSDGIEEVENVPDEVNERNQSLRNSVAAAADRRAKLVSQHQALSKAIETIPSESVDEEGKSDEIVSSVYCDLCSKVRQLSNDEKNRLKLQDDSPFNCTMVSRDGVGCNALDDELIAFAGNDLTNVLANIEITTRKAFADANVNDLIYQLIDPLTENRDQLQMQLEELHDSARYEEVEEVVTQEILCNTNNPLNIFRTLEQQKLSTPADILCTPVDLLYKSIEHNIDGEESFSIKTVEQWQMTAKQILKEKSWMNDWRSI